MQEKPGEALKNEAEEKKKSRQGERRLLNIMRRGVDSTRGSDRLFSGKKVEGEKSLSCKDG